MVAHQTIPSTQGIVITGPTCSGKSQLALSLAEQYPQSVLINADSMQIYSDLPILTASHRSESLAQIEHRLYGILSAPQICSAGLWQTWCHDEIARCRSRGYLPIIIGGSGLYLHTLIDPLTEIPKIPEAIHHQAHTYLKTLGSVEFHKLLVQDYPDAASHVRPSDGHRIVRAWEVAEATGQTLAQWHAQKSTRQVDPNPQFRWIILLPSRDRLYHACNIRFDAMMANHVLDEIDAFEARNIDPTHPLHKVIGLPELRRFRHGTLDQETAIQQAKQATRRYAKRQSDVDSSSVYCPAEPS